MYATIYVLNCTIFVRRLLTTEAAIPTYVHLLGWEIRWILTLQHTFAFTAVGGCYTASSRHAAYNVNVVSTTCDSATVTWNPAYDNAQDIHYVLWYVKIFTIKEIHYVIWYVMIFTIKDIHYVLWYVMMMIMITKHEHEQQQQQQQ